MRLVLLTLLLAPQLAHAAPVFYAIGTFFGASAATAVAVGMTVVQIGLTIATAVYGAAQRRRAARKARDAYNASLQDRTISRIATEAPLVHIYGIARVGSSIVAMLTSGDKDQFKHMVCVHAAHVCDEIVDIYIAGKALGPLDEFGRPESGPFVKFRERSRVDYRSGQTFTLDEVPKDGVVKVYPYVYGWEDTPEEIPAVVSGKQVTLAADYGQVQVTYTCIEKQSSVSVVKYLGNQTAASTELRTEYPNLWPATAILRGLCYTVVKLDLNDQEFQGGPPSVEALIRGKPIYDPRTKTAYFSRNAALVIRDYLVSEMCGVDPEDLPDDQFIAAANVCDEIIRTLPVPVLGAINVRRYQIDGVVTSEQDQVQVLEKMVQAMAGGMVATTWDIWAGKYTAPVMALDQTDIVGSLAISPGVSDADLFNGVRGQFHDTKVATDFKPYKNEAYALADGREKWVDIDFPFTTDVSAIHNIARILVEDQRNGYTVTGEFSLKAWKLKVGQRVTLSSELFGWSDKVFRITDKKFSPTSAVELTMKEDAPSIWDLADEVLLDATPNTNLPDPYYVAPITSLTFSSGNQALLELRDGTVISRMKVSWPQHASQYIISGGYIEISTLPTVGDPVPKITQVHGSETHAYVSDVIDGVQYQVGIRAVNPYLNARSDWSYAYYTVVGKTQPPPQLSSFSMTIRADRTRAFSFSINNQPADVRNGGGVRIRYRESPSTDEWESCLPLHEGLIGASPFETSLPVAGTYDIGAAVVDSSGNESPVVWIYDAVIGDVPGRVYRADIAPGAVGTEEIAIEAVTKPTYTINDTTIVLFDGVLTQVAALTVETDGGDMEVTFGLGVAIYNSSSASSVYTNFIDVFFRREWFSATTVGVSSVSGGPYPTITTTTPHGIVGSKTVGFAGTGCMWSRTSGSVTLGGSLDTADAKGANYTVTALNATQLRLEHPENWTSGASGYMREGIIVDLGDATGRRILSATGPSATQDVIVDRVALDSPPPGTWTYRCHAEFDLNSGMGTSTGRAKAGRIYLAEIKR